MSDFFFNSALGDSCDYTSLKNTKIEEDVSFKNWKSIPLLNCYWVPTMYQALL